MPKFRSKEEQNQDDQLRQLLGGGEFTDPEKTAPGTWRRQRRDLGMKNFKLKLGFGVNFHLFDCDEKIFLIQTGLLIFHGNEECEFSVNLNCNQII